VPLNFRIQSPKNRIKHQDLTTDLDSYNFVLGFKSSYVEIPKVDLVT